MDQVAARREGSARVCAAHAVVHIDLGDSQSRTGLTVHEPTGIFSDTIRPISSGRQKQHIDLSGEKSCRRQSQVLVATTAAGSGGKLHSRLTTPDTDLSGVQMQLVCETNGESRSVTIKAVSGSTHIETQFLSRNTDRIDGEIERCNDGPFNPIRVTGRRSEHSRTDDGRIVAGNVGDKQRTTGSIAQQTRHATALDSRQPGASRVELTDGDATRQPFRVEPSELFESHTRLQHLDETRGATRDQKQGLDGARQLLQPFEEARTSVEGSAVWNWMRALVNLHAAKCVDLRSNVIVFGDDQRSLD